MLSKMKVLAGRLINLGQVMQQNYYDQLRFRVFNIVLLTISVAFLLMIMSDLITGNKTVVYSLYGLGFMIFLFFLIHKKQTNLAIFIFCTLVPLQLFVVTVYYGEGLNINYTYPAFIIVVLLSFKSNRLKGVLITMIFLLQVGGIYYVRYYGSILTKDIPLLDGLLLLVLPSLGIGLLVFKQVEAIKGLYEKQKVFSEELEEKNRDLETVIRQLEDKNQLLAIIAHDLKGPAANFINLSKNINYLIEKGKVDRLKSLAEGFEESGHKVYHTISNLLNWVAAQQKGIVVQHEHFKIRAIFRNIQSSLEYYILRKKIRIQLLFDETVLVYTDKNILGVILLNILSNAIKYSTEEGGIKVYCREESDAVVIEIEDEGVGMDEEQIEQIYNSQSTVRADIRGEYGHGIGLKICFFLIKRLGGEIKISSKPNQGAKFSIHIPREASQEE
jgi:signal transduction histidine kinase